MPTTPKSAAEKLLTNLPATAATALRGDRDALVELLDIAYHNGRLDALIERLDARMSDLREQRAARDATPIVEFPLPARLDREPVEIEHQSERSLERGFDLPGGLA